MISSSQNNEPIVDDADGAEIVLQTFDNEKELSFCLLRTRADAVYEYLVLGIRAGGKFVQACGTFVVSLPQMSDFIQGLLSEPASQLEDENGRGSISITAEDSLGHFLVRINMGGLEEDQATISFATDQTAISSLKEDLGRMLLSASS